MDETIFDKLRDIDSAHIQKIYLLILASIEARMTKKEKSASIPALAENGSPQEKPKKKKGMSLLTKFGLTILVILCSTFGMGFITRGFFISEKNTTLQCGGNTAIIPEGRTGMCSSNGNLVVK